MTIPSVSPSTTRSRTLATFGWSMEVRIDRSWKNRATTSVSETSSGLSTFTATGVPDPRTVPRNTWPMAPRPSKSCSTYLLPKGVSTRITPLVLRSACGRNGASVRRPPVVQRLIFRSRGDDAHLVIVDSPDNSERAVGPDAAAELPGDRTIVRPGAEIAAPGAVIAVLIAVCIVIEPRCGVTRRQGFDERARGRPGQGRAVDRGECIDAQLLGGADTVIEDSRIQAVRQLLFSGAERRGACGRAGGL